MKQTKRPNLKVVRWPVAFNAGDNYVNAVFDMAGSSFGVRFESPEQLLDFFEQLMSKAAQVWPENEWVQLWQTLD